MDANKRIKTAAMMHWKIFIFSVCSLTFSIHTIASAQIDPTSVSYPQNYALTQATKEFRQQYQQLARPAVQSQSSPPSDFYPMRSYASTTSRTVTQPNVYHSIIDKTNALPSASPAIQTSVASTSDLNTAAGHHHGQAYGKYYEYRAVPKPKTWKFGYKRGNHKHTISRHEHGKAGKHPHFKTKVKWHDSKSHGKGIHLWDYNHHDKKHYHHHG